MMIKLSTMENPSGRVWDHKGDKELVQIFISHDSLGINFLQFHYVENGTSVLSERPENSSLGKKFTTVTLNYPDEFLTSITGSCVLNIHSGNERETSITFGTNKGSHGPFGKPDKYNDNFNFQMGQNRHFGGFHGSNKDGYLESIGVYVKPITILNNINSGAGGGGGEVKKRENLESVL